jgi:hypothetical protein
MVSVEHNNRLINLNIDLTKMVSGTSVSLKDLAKDIMKVADTFSVEDVPVNPFDSLNGNFSHKAPDFNALNMKTGGNRQNREEKYHNDETFKHMYESKNSRGEEHQYLTDLVQKRPDFVLFELIDKLADAGLFGGKE